MRDYTVGSLTILHYGRDYLPYSLRSVAPVVDRQSVFYTPHPSHGHSTDLPLIETRDELVESVFFDNWDKLHWYDSNNFWQEGQQRDYALSVTSQHNDLILTLDYDEIWYQDVLRIALDYVWQQNKARNWLVNMLHFWRSFGYVCTDDNWPVRIFDTRHSSGVAYLPKELGDILHFGYAISTDVLKYKLSCHGHRDELRPNWFADKWSAWPPVDDCHPTNGRKENGEGWWNPKPFDKWQLPEIMHSHKWFNESKIE